MSDDQKSDDEIIAADRRWWRRWYVLSLLLAIAAVPLAVIWFNFVLEHHPFVSLGLTPQAEQQVLLIIPVLFFIGVVFAMRFVVGRPPAMQNEQIVRKTSDSHYARMRWLYPLVILVFARMLFGPQDRLEEEPLLFYSTIGALVVQAVVLLRGFGWARAFRRGLDDELTRDLRRKATQFGYGLTVALIAAACIYTRYESVPPGTLMLRLLFVASIAPMLCFLILEWRSGRDG
jgi:hypothetical protein